MINKPKRMPFKVRRVKFRSELKRGIRIDNLEEVLDDLNKEVGKVLHRTLKGLVAGGLVMQRGSQKRTPVDTGNLRASAFTIWGTKTTTTIPAMKGPDAGIEETRFQTITSERTHGLSKNPWKPEVEVGHTASYAVYVHEDLTARHYTGMAKFLVRAAREDRAQIMAAVRGEF